MRALVPVDLQVDYFNHPALVACRGDLVEACNLLLDAAGRHGVPVFEVRTVHAPDGSTWALNMREDGQGLTLAGTPGAEPVAGLRREGATVVEKTRDSAFHGTRFREVLERHGVDHLVLCGVSTESCILATASDAYAHDLRVTLVEDATASVDPEEHDHALESLRSRFRQEVVSAAQAAHQLGSSPATRQASSAGAQRH